MVWTRLTTGLCLTLSLGCGGNLERPDAPGVNAASGGPTVIGTGPAPGSPTAICVAAFAGSVRAPERSEFPQFEPGSLAFQVQRQGQWSRLEHKALPPVWVASGAAKQVMCVRESTEDGKIKLEVRAVTWPRLTSVTTFHGSEIRISGSYELRSRSDDPYEDLWRFLQDDYGGLEWIQSEPCRVDSDGPWAIVGDHLYRVQVAQNALADATKELEAAICKGKCALRSLRLLPAAKLSALVYEDHGARLALFDLSAEHPRLEKNQSVGDCREAWIAPVESSTPLRWACQDENKDREVNVGQGEALIKLSPPEGFHWTWLARGEAQFSSDGSQLAAFVGNSDETEFRWCFWDATSGVVRGCLPIRLGRTPLNVLSSGSLADKRTMAVHYNESLVTWDLQASRGIGRVSLPFDRGRASAVLPSGGFVVAVSGALFVWDPPVDGKYAAAPSETIALPPGSARRISLYDDAKLLAVVGDDAIYLVELGARSVRELVLPFPGYPISDAAVTSPASVMCQNFYRLPHHLDSGIRNSTPFASVTSLRTVGVVKNPDSPTFARFVPPPPTPLDGSPTKRILPVYGRPERAITGFTIKRDTSMTELSGTTKSGRGIEIAFESTDKSARAYKLNERLAELQEGDLVILFIPGLACKTDKAQAPWMHTDAEGNSIVQCGAGGGWKQVTVRSLTSKSNDVFLELETQHTLRDGGKTNKIRATKQDGGWYLLR